MSGRSTAAQDALAGLLAPVVEAAGVDLEQLVITPAGKRRVVRVVVDADGGVDLDRVADVSRAVSEVLDTTPEADRALGGAPYVLEVTSPGTDRPLTEPRHWRRATSRLVRVRLADGTEVLGRVTAPGDTTAVLTTPEGERTVVYADVARALVQVEFDRKHEGDEDSDHERGDDELGDDEPREVGNDDVVDDEE